MVSTGFMTEDQVREMKLQYNCPYA
jgi:hypothetical protein